MPDTREFQNNVISAYPNVSSVNHNLDEAMLRLKVEENFEEVDPYANPYPDRPGEPDCVYYMKTGSCGYGNNCRYNHPSYAVQGTQAKVELPERAGQPDCQFFLRTGMCKFGTTCKYNHPRDRQDARTVQFNILGFPMRQDEKSCSYYMRTGNCKFGVACKFDHPQPATVGAVYPLTGSSAFGSTLSSVVQAPSGISAWQSSNRTPFVPSPHMQCLPAYMPFVLPPTTGTMPLQQGWTTYTGTVNQFPSADAHGHSTETPPKSRNNAYPSPSSFIENLPERPDQPECQYYLKTGSCKYGSACKYHHPRERITAAAVGPLGPLGPLGLPLRPGHAVCSFYSMYGTCRFGSACRFDHPLVGFYNYSLPFFPSQRGAASPKIMKSEAPPASDSDGFRTVPLQTASPSPPPESLL